MLVAIGDHCPSTVPTFLADDVDLGGQEGVGVTDHRPDIQIVLPVLDGDMERMAAFVEVGDDRLVAPIAVAVNDVATIAVSKQLGVEVRVVRPRVGVGTDPDFAHVRRMVPLARPLDPVQTAAMEHRFVDALGTRIHLVEEGSGPLVLFVHGFPESWYSWRHQIPAVAGAGFRAVAIDVRGYGRSHAPLAVEDYRMVRHVADNVGVVRALGEQTAVIVGHDWGAPIAWSSALLRPDVFTGLGLLSVPYNPRSSFKPSDQFRLLGGAEEFYIEYFQTVGRAEAEIETDLAKWLLGFYYSASGDAPRGDGRGSMVHVGPTGRLVDRFAWPEAFPPWLAEADFAFYLEEFERTGLTGGLNRYRNVDRDWADLAAWDGAAITQPSIFIGGEKDGPTMWGSKAIAAFPQTMPNLTKSVIVPGCGHWVQQEEAELVNQELIEFLTTSS